MKLQNNEISNLFIVIRESNNFNLGYSLSYIGLLFNLFVGVKYLDEITISIFIIIGILIRISSILIIVYGRYSLMSIGSIQFFKDKLILFFNKKSIEVDLVKSNVYIGKARRVRCNGHVTFLNDKNFGEMLFTVAIKVKSDISPNKFELLLSSKDEIDFMNSLKLKLLNAN